MIEDADLLPAVMQGERLPSPLLVAKAKRAAEFAKNATAASTRKLYGGVFAAFARWCDEHDAPALPTTPEILATYLQDMHEEQGRAASYLGLMRAAVLWTHRQAKLPFDSRAECLRQVISAAKRQRRADPKRVRPFLVEDFHKLSAAMGDSLIDVRDRAMFALGLARALRGPSELVSLDLDRLGDVEGRGFIEIGTAGITVKLVRSKTSQESTREMFIERGPAVEAVDAWIRAGGITAGTPLWRPLTNGMVHQTRLSARMWHEIVKRRVAQFYRLEGMSAEEAAREARKFATHSLRSGMITSLARSGAHLNEIRDVTGHAEGSAAILLGYIREHAPGVAKIKEVGL
jgi:site-specific recombinase XerC